MDSDVIDRTLNTKFESEAKFFNNKTNSPCSLNSSVSKSRSSSSEYELVSDITIEGSDNEEFEKDIFQCGPKNVNKPVLTEQDDFIQANEPSDPTGAMEEVYEVVEEDAVEEKSDEPTVSSDVNKNVLPDDDDDFVMDEIIAEFAEDEKKKQNVVKLSDNEDEIDHLLDEFVVTQSDSNVNDGPVNDVILSSDDEDGMESLLEEFSKENALDDEPECTKLMTSDDSDVNKGMNIVSEPTVKNSSSNENHPSIPTVSENVLPASQFSANSVNSPRNDMSDIDAKSDSSSVEILVLDDAENADEDDKIKPGEDSSYGNKSAIEDSDSESQKLNFEDMIIVDEVQDNSDTEIGKLIAGTGDCVSDSVKESLKASESSLSFAHLGNEINHSATLSSDSSCLKNTNLSASNKRTSDEKDYCCDMKETNHKSFDSVPDNKSVSDVIHTSEISKNMIKSAITSSKVSCDLDIIVPATEIETDPTVQTKKNYPSKISIGTDVIESSKEFENENTVCESSRTFFDSNVSNKSSNDKKVITKDSSVIENDFCGNYDNASSVDDLLCSLKHQCELVNDQNNLESIKLHNRINTILDTLDNDLNSENYSKNVKTCSKTVVNAINVAASISKKENYGDIGHKEKIPGNSQREKYSTDTNIGNDCWPPDILETTSESVKSVDFVIGKLVQDIANGASTSSNHTISVEDKENDIVVVDDTSPINSLETSSEDKKRKLEDASETGAKRTKTECIHADKANNDKNASKEKEVYDGIEIIDSQMEKILSDATCKVLSKDSYFFPGSNCKRIKGSKKVFDMISLYLCHEVVKEHFIKSIQEAEVQSRDLKKELDVLSKSLDSFRDQASEFHNSQRRSFAEHNFKPKESDLKQAVTMQSNKPVNDSERLSCKPGVKAPLLPTSNATDAKPVPTLALNHETLHAPFQVRKQLAARILTHPTRPYGPKPNPVLINAPAPAPNVTVRGNHFVQYGNTVRPTATTTTSGQSVLLLPSKNATSNPLHLDLMKDNKLNANAGNKSITVPTTVVNKMPLPGTSNASNVFVPLRDNFLFLPGARGSVAVQSQGNRPVLNQFPANARTVAYIMPAGATGVGARGLPAFMPTSSNQQVQFVLRMTNPGSMSGFNTIVNSVSRMPGAPQQPSLTNVPRMTGVSRPPLLRFSRPPMSQNVPTKQPSVLMLSQTPKHPAPFPKAPEYPETGKAIPPKPTLKGNKNPNGIVLSWNMCMFKNQAAVASYQLFAYQETDGPVDASLWKKVGDVNALPLPMACTLTQFIDKNRYYFTVRAVDVFNRAGPFSDPVSILYEKSSVGKK